MSHDLQQLVDSLAKRMKRSVAIDDHAMRLLASSEHFEDVDEVRMGSLIGRSVHGAALEYVVAQGVSTWRTPRRLPAKPSVGIAHDRYCFPLWGGMELLGFMWLIDDGGLSEAEIVLAQESAESIRSTLATRSAKHSPFDARLADLSHQVLRGRPREVEEAVNELRDLGVDVDAPHIAVKVISHREGGFAQYPEMVRAAMSGMARDRRLAVHFCCIDDHDLVLAVAIDVPSKQSDFQEVAQAVRHHVAAATNDDSHFVVGVGDPANVLHDIRRSAAQASTACRVACARGTTHATWSADAIETTLALLVRPEVSAADMPTPVRRLLSEDPALCDFVEVHLDGGCVAATTADRLFLHRATVYYRLDRLREHYGLDLRDGRTRLLLHLWLVARPYFGQENEPPAKT